MTNTIITGNDTGATVQQPHVQNEPQNTQNTQRTQQPQHTHQETTPSGTRDKFVPSPDESALDETISKILQAVQSSTNLHSLDELSNITLENSMDNSLEHRKHTSLSRSTIDVPGQTKSKINPNGLINDLNSKLVIVMVGLPARGKSYLTKKITRYLNWLQYNTKIFNVGNTRRLSKQNHGPADRPFEMQQQQQQHQQQQHQHQHHHRCQELADHHTTNNEHDANFFDPQNQASLLIREQWAMNTLDQLINYLMRDDGTVGIFDATNTTKLRRRHIIEAIRAKTPEHSNLKILFLESVCTDNRMIRRNMKLKLSGPDYKDKDPKLALKDFRNRLINYEHAYETIDEEEEQYYEDINENLQYIKIFNAGKKITSYNISGFLSSQVIFFMLNFNLNERQIWIARHGETYDNLNGKLGCSKQGSKLTPVGQRYSQCLARFMNFKKKEFRLRQLKKHYIDESYLDEEDEEDNTGISTTPQPPKKKSTKVIPELHFSVWSSMLAQTIQTSNYFNDQNFNIKQLKMLNELSHGKVNGMSLKKFATKFPMDFKNYQNTYHTDDTAHSSRKKLLYRFPGGESYLDVINRLRPLIVELERMEDHCLLITHKVVARVLLSYFMNLGKEYITELDVPLHSVYVLEPKPYGVDWNMYQYNAEVDWFFPVDKDKILRKKKKREVIPSELIDLYSSTMNNRKKQMQSSRTNFYFDSPSEPGTPKNIFPEKSRVSLNEIENIIFARSDESSLAGDFDKVDEEELDDDEDEKPDNVNYFKEEDEDEESGSDSDNEGIIEDNEHWYKYQLDNVADYDDDDNDNADEDEYDDAVQYARDNRSSEDFSLESRKTKHKTSSSHSSLSSSSSVSPVKKGGSLEKLHHQPLSSHFTKGKVPVSIMKQGRYSPGHQKSGSTSPSMMPIYGHYNDNDLGSVPCTKFNSNSSSINYNTPKTLSVNNSDINLRMLPNLAKVSSLNKHFEDLPEDAQQQIMNHTYNGHIRSTNKEKVKLAVGTNLH